MQNQSAAAPEVVVAVVTRHRPDDLARLLSRLPRVIDVARTEGEAGAVRVMVVDNDARGSARQPVQNAPMGIEYHVEARVGVSAARNRVLAEVGSGPVLVFIDDDETPETDRWLGDLLRTRRAYRADAVAGPVRTEFGGPVHPWVAAGGFFARAHRAGLQTGSAIDRAATNNLLLDTSFTSRHNLTFDDRFGRSGGEDSMFTSQVHAAGGRIVWCAEARVVDHLSGARLTLAHSARRTRGMASAGARVAVALRGTATGRLRSRLRSLASGGARVLTGVAGLALGAATHSDTRSATGYRDLHRGLGAIVGAIGRVSVHYGEDDASPSAPPESARRDRA